MIKKWSWVLLGICFYVVHTSCSMLSPARLLQHPSTMQVTPLRVHYPQPERMVLENGMVLYLLEDHELPLIELTAAIRVGSAYDPADRAGLAALTGSVMRTGGTAKLSPDEIDAQLEYMDAQIDISLDTEPGTASLSVLKKDVDRALDIFAQLLRYPAFNNDRLVLAQEQKIASLRRTNDNPQNLALRQFKKLLYRNNPRGNLPTVASIRRIKKDDLISFQRKFFHPNRILMAVSGDFSRPEMIEAIKKRFADWKPSYQDIPRVPLPLPVPAREVFHLQKKIPQSTIITGHLAPQKSHPDYCTFEVLNFILGGGGFTSRLTSEIRSSRGLAYSVGSFFRGDVDYGVFGAYCMTKSSTTHQALSLMLDIMNSIRDNVTAQELEWAKESLLNSFIFSFSSSSQVVTQQMLLEYEQLPRNFLDTFPSRIKAITLDDVQRVAREYLHPSQSIVLTIGDAQDFDKPLSDLGPVSEVFSDIQG